MSEYQAILERIAETVGLELNPESSILVELAEVGDPKQVDPESKTEGCSFGNDELQDTPESKKTEDTEASNDGNNLMSQLEEFREDLGDKLISSPDPNELQSDGISVVSVAGSVDSDDKPPSKCFSFMKLASPQRVFSRFIGKRDVKSPKKGLLDACFSPPTPDRSDAGYCSPESPSFSVFYSHIGPFSSNIKVERIDYASLAEKHIIPVFLGSHPCYNVMPISGKVIVLSVELVVKNAFGALETNEIRAAPLWDAGIFNFVGMLTISDFINVLRHYYYTSPEDIKDIENQSIATWRQILRIERPFVKVNGLDSLAQATKMLIQDGVHRLPVFDEKRQCVLFVLTRKRLLHFLNRNLFENFDKTNVRTPSFFKKTIRELKVGTFDDIAKVESDTKVIEALDLFVKRKVSSLPVVDKDGVLIDIFEKFDVFALAKEQTYHNLHMPVTEAIVESARINASKSMERETAWICTLDDSLGTVINKFVTKKVHRLVALDENKLVVGIISLSDVLKFLVIEPLASMEASGISSGPASETIDEAAEGAIGGSGSVTPTQQDSELSETGPESSMSDKMESDLLEGISSLKIDDPKETNSVDESKDTQPE